MNQGITNNLVQAQNEVSASSAGGAPFLIAYGATLFITAILAFFIPINVVALIAMFQGSIALPLAFWLERQMGSGPMSPDNPLRPLSVQMAMSQILALPAVIVAYSLDPHLVPVVLAAVGGAHFLTYAWLHRTQLYIILAVAISIGAFAIQLLFQAAAFQYILIYMSLVYWMIAPLVYRHAASFSKKIQA
jgi:hypothetical protein